MVEDVEQKEKKKEEEEKKEEKKTTWFQKVPTIWKVVGAVVIFIQFQRLSAAGGNFQQLWVWILGVLIILYFMGAEGKRQEEHLLTPEEAEEALEAEIKRKIKKGQISRFARIDIGPNNGWFVYEGMPKHYIIGLKITEDNFPRSMKGIVIAEGDAKGYATMQGHPGEVQGSEQIPVATPGVFKTLKKYDIDYERFLFGDKRK